MAEVAVLNMQGKEVGRQELSDSVFGIEPNVPVMNDMVKNYLANQRQGTQSALTRSEVSGGGRKPWRQKGTGRARQGRYQGYTRSWKKAVVTLTEESRTIEFFESMV